MPKTAPKKIVPTSTVGDKEYTMPKTAPKKTPDAPALATVTVEQMMRGIGTTMMEDIANARADIRALAATVEAQSVEVEKMRTLLRGVAQGMAGDLNRVRGEMAADGERMREGVEEMRILVATIRGVLRLDPATRIEPRIPLATFKATGPVQVEGVPITGRPDERVEWRPVALKDEAPPMDREERQEMAQAPGGGFRVKFDPPGWKARMGGVSYAGRPVAECPPGYLRELRDWKRGAALDARKEGSPKALAKAHFCDADADAIDAELSRRGAADAQA